MRLVVLGGSGFIGSHAVAGLVRAGHEVTVVSRRAQPILPREPAARYQQVDYRHTDRLADLIAGKDAVLHTIGTTFPGSVTPDPRSEIADDLMASVAILDLMEAVGVRRLIYISSGGTVYGVPDTLPVPETHALRPINSYGIVKVAIESYIGLHARTKGLSSVILRPSNPYGDGQGAVGSQGLINTLLRRALSGEAVEIWGDGSIVRDYFHVRDLARLCVAAAESDVTGVFNAGSGTGISVRDLVDLVSEVTGRELNVNYGPGRLVDIPSSILDVSAAAQTFGWVPNITLRDGIARTWDSLIGASPLE